MHNSNNLINKNDPLIGSVQKVMKENQIRRDVEKTINEEIGVYSKKALPFELHKAYDEVLEESVQATLSEEGKIQIIDKKGFMNALKKGKKSEKKESEKEYGVEKEREMASKKKGMYEQEGSAPSTPKEKALAAKHGNPRVITKGDVLAARGVIKGSNMEEKKLEERKINPYAIGMAAVKKSTGDEPPMEKKNITKAHKIAKKIMKRLDERVGNPLMAQQNQQRAANDLQTQRMAAREPAAPAPKAQPTMFDNLVSGAKRVAADVATNVLGSDASTRLQAAVKGTTVDQERKQDAEKGIDKTKDIISTTVDAGKRAAADAATAVLGPDRSAGLQALVKGTDPAKEKAQETEKAAIVAGQAQRSAPAPEAPRTSPAARNEPRDSSPTTPAKPEAPKPFEFTADEKAGKVSKDRLDAWRASQAGGGKDLSLGNFLNAAQGKKAIAGGKNDQTAGQRALNARVASGATNESIVSRVMSKVAAKKASGGK